jgi:pimeloyl-ACP methyl ester carboxylesterase
MTETVVLVHGVLMSGRELALLSRRLRRCGFTPLAFDYPSRRRQLRDNARALVEFVAELHSPVVHLVGHSLGGLVILQALVLQPELPPGRVVLLGSPVRGSQVARRLAGLPGGRWLLGRSLDGLLGNVPGWQGRRELGLIAGTLPLGVGWVTGGLAGRHDGTVAVAETRLAGAPPAMEVHTSHTGLVFSAAVARQVCSFLRHGRFATPGAAP